MNIFAMISGYPHLYGAIEALQLGNQEMVLTDAYTAAMAIEGLPDVEIEGFIPAPVIHGT